MKTGRCRGRGDDIIMEIDIISSCVVVADHLLTSIESILATKEVEVMKEVSIEVGVGHPLLKFLRTANLIV